MQNLLFCCFWEKKHCVGSVLIRSFSGPYFPAFGPKRSISPYSVRMWDQKNSDCGHFSCSECTQENKFRIVLGYWGRDSAVVWELATLKIPRKIPWRIWTTRKPETIQKLHFKMDLHCRSTGFLEIFHTYWEKLFCETLVRSCFFRSGRSVLFCKKGVLINFAKFTVKDLWQSLIKLQVWELQIY